MSNKIEQNLKEYEQKTNYKPIVNATFETDPKKQEEEVLHPDQEAIKGIDKAIEDGFKKVEYDYVKSITSYHCTENEIYIGCEVIDENTLEVIDKTIVFNAMDVLTSGLSDRNTLKENIKKYIDKL